VTVPIVSPPMRRKAEALAELVPLMSRGRSKETGQPFIVVPASNRLTAHWTAVDGSGCTCLGYQRRGTCTHAIAAKIVHDRQAQPAPAPKKSYADLFPECSAPGCSELVERKGALCYPCSSEQVRRVDAAARQQRIA
jgi:hypothetical protein